MTTESLRIGVFVCDCGLNIASTVDTEEVARYARELPGVAAVVRNRYTCADPGQKEIQKAIREHRLNRVVVASCTPTNPFAAPSSSWAASSTVSA